MNILHLCPLWFPICPNAPGGIETFLARLVVALDRLGCRNTLLAAGGSSVTTRVIPATPSGVRDMMADGVATEYTCYEQHQLALAFASAGEFDVIHSHIGVGAYPLSLSGYPLPPVLHTQHIPVLIDQAWLLALHPEMWFSTVSRFQHQRLHHPRPERCPVVPNGLEVAEFRFELHPGGGLFFIGRIEWAKGPDLAIRVAQMLDLPLILAGPVVDGEFFELTIRPHLNERIRYIGEIDHLEKNTEYGRAACTILPFRGAESFGLVSIESMACGTPVVALNNGALPEVVDEGVTGYVTGKESELGALVRQAMALDRVAVRARVSQRFDIAVVAERYHELYAHILAEEAVS